MVSTPDASTSRSWRRWLLMPSAARLGAKAPDNPKDGWDQFWSEIEATGDGGDVLWDTSNPGEMEQYLPAALKYLDPGLPTVDVGCGNGRQARILANHFPEVLGIDLSQLAVERAQAESAGVANLRFQALDIVAPGAGAKLVEAIGEANVFVRGVFHVLPPKARRDMVANLREVLGRSGHLFLAETNYPGDSLGYLRHLGARLGSNTGTYETRHARPQTPPFRCHRTIELYAGRRMGGGGRWGHPDLHDSAAASDRVRIHPRLLRRSAPLTDGSSAYGLPSWCRLQNHLAWYGVGTSRCSVEGVEDVALDVVQTVTRQRHHHALIAEAGSARVSAVVWCRSPGASRSGHG